MDNIKLVSALIISLFCWASAFIGIRIGLNSYSPGALALLRFLIASLCMLIFYRRATYQKSIPFRIRLELIVIGIGAIGVYNLCLNTGEMSVSAGVASFIIGLIPVFTICMSILFLKERPDYRVWIGILVSFLGLVLIVLAERASLSAVSGIAVILISSLMGGFYNISQKRYLTHYHPVAITAWVIWGGTLMLLAYAPALKEEIVNAQPVATWAAVYMGVFPAALAYAAWCFILAKLPAAKAATYLYALPLLSTLMGMVILHEHPSELSLLGGVVALGGAFIANRAKSTPLNHYPQESTTTS